MATVEPTQNGTVTASNPLLPENFSDAQPPTAEADASAANATEAVNPPTQEPEAAEVETGTATTATTSTPPEKRWPGWPGDCVFRLIVPVGKVGSIIGRKGELIKKMCEETRARIRVLDGAVGTPDRVVSLNSIVDRI